MFAELFRRHRLLVILATALVQVTGGTAAVGVYLLVMSLVAPAAVLPPRDRSGIDLGIGKQAEQETGATVFERPRGA